MTHRLVAALAASGVLLVVSACAGRAPFAERSFADVERVLAAGDLAVCAETTDRDGMANQAIATRTYVVAAHCTGAPTPGDGSVRLVVDRFDDEGHRDGAARQFESLVRPRGDGAVWTWGPFTLFANGARDDDVMDRLSDALDDAGAR